MNRKAFTIALHSWLLLAVTGLCLAANDDIGKKAPFFKVRSGDDKELTFDTVKGKVLVIFYETKEVVEKNRELKEALKRLSRDQHYQPDASVGIPVVNCSGAFWPFTRIWKSKLRENSRKEGLTIYGDWDGKMFSDYKMKRDESNVIVIDTKGVIRYRKAGEIDSEGIREIERLIRNLVAEGKTASSEIEEETVKDVR